MGATGHGVFPKREHIDTVTFGIGNAVTYKGQIPPKSGLEPVSQKKVTLKLPSKDGNVLLQFRLSKDQRSLIVSGYQDGQKAIKTNLTLSAVSPSVQSIIQNGSGHVLVQATTLQQLMAKSSMISDYQLQQIVEYLKQKG